MKDKVAKTEIGSLRMKGDGAKLDVRVLVSPTPLHRRLQISKQLPRVLSLQLSINQTWRQLLSRGYFGDFHEQGVDGAKPKRSLAPLASPLLA